VTPVPRATVVAYAAVALPLAAGAVPLYINVASVYADSFGAQIAGVGAALLAARAADAFVDPYLGTLIERLRRPRLIVVAGVALLAVGLVLAFHPPWKGPASIAWLPIALLPAYLGHSIASIAYLGLAAAWGDTGAERARLAIWREGFGLVGILLATVAPPLAADDPVAALARSSLIFALLAPAAVALALQAVRVPPLTAISHKPAWLDGWRAFAQAPFRPLLFAFVLNGVANALPATLVLFFVADVIDAKQGASLFLLAYFAAGALGLPAWVALTTRWSGERAWRLSMLLGAMIFAGASVLGPGDALPFLAICIATGLMLGGDLALPAALLTAALQRRNEAASAPRYFGVWTFAAKMAAAIGAGVGLPAVGMLGYLPGSPETASSLQAVYCVVPCALKVAAAAIVPTPTRTLA